MFLQNFKILGANFPMHYIRTRWKKEKEKRRENKFHFRGFLLHKILQPSEGAYRICRLALIGAEKSVTKNFVGEKKKKEQINKMISIRMLILSYTMWSVMIWRKTPDFLPLFRPPSKEAESPAKKNSYVFSPTYHFKVYHYDNPILRYL